MTFPCTLQSRGVRQPVRALSGENIVRTARSPLWHKAKSLQQKQIFKAPAQAAEASRSCCCCRYGSSPFTNNPWPAEGRASRLDSCGVGPTFGAMSVTRALRRRLSAVRLQPIVTVLTEDG